MVRRLILFVAVATGLLAIAAAGLVAFRLALAEALLSSQLGSLGVPAAELSVASLDLHRMVLRDISLGRAGELRIDTATLTYRPGALLSGRLEEAAIDGIRLRLDLAGGGPPLGSLQPLVEGGGGAPGAGAIPEVVTLTGGRIEAAAPGGGTAVSVSARWRPFAGTATLALSDLALPNLDLETSRLDFEATRDRIVATAAARGKEHALDLDLRATVESLRGAPALALELEGSLAPATWNVRPVPGVDGGTIALSARLDGRLQPIRSMSLGPAALDWLLGGNLDGRLHASLEDVDYRGRAQGISGDLDLAVTAADGALDLVVAEEARIRADRIDPAWLDALGLLAVAPQLGDSGVTVSLPANEAPMRLRLKPGDAGADLAVSGTGGAASGEARLEVRTDGNLALDEGYGVRQASFPQADFRLRDLVVAGHRLVELRFTGAIDGTPADLEGAGDLAAELAATRIGTLETGGATVGLAADFRWIGDRLAVRQSGDGSATVASLDMAGAARVPEPFDLAVSDGQLTLDVAPDGLEMTHAVTLRPESATVELTRADGDPRVVRANAGTVRLTGRFGSGTPYRGEIDLADGSFMLSDPAISTESVSAAIVFPPPVEEPLARFAVGRLEHTAAPAYVAPLRLDGEIAREGDTLLLNAAGAGVDHGFRFSLRGEHFLEQGRGTLRIDVPETTFLKDGLQPGHLSPLLGDLREAAGRIGGAAALAWGPGGLDGSGRLDMAGLSFVTGVAAVEGLDSRIALDGLFPPSTPPGQLVTVRRVDPALPLDDVEVRFELDPAEPLRLRLEEANAGFAGGRLSVSDTVLDPSGPRQDLEVGVDGVDLGHLLSLLEVEDISGTGRLSGTVPVAVTSAGVSIRDGRLATQGPGVLRVASEAAAKIFGQAGKEVTLMLSALEDFRYDSLSATLDMTPDGNTDIAVRMEGHNPAVLEGYPFAFNVGLDANLLQLLAALRRGRGFSTDLVRPVLP